MQFQKSFYIILFLLPKWLYFQLLFLILYSCFELGFGMGASFDLV